MARWVWSVGAAVLKIYKIMNLLHSIGSFWSLRFIRARRREVNKMNPHLAKIVNSGLLFVIVRGGEHRPQK